MNAGVFLVGCCQILTFPIFPSKMKGREPDNPESRGAERRQIPWFCLVLAETRAVEDGASMQAINLGTSGLPGCLGPSSRWLSSVTGTSGTLCREGIRLGKRTGEAEWPSCAWFVTAEGTAWMSQRCGGSSGFS